MLSSKDILKKYDLSSIRLLFTGAAPLGKETAEELLKIYPTWHIGQGYGKSSPIRSSMVTVTDPCQA
jgi:acyl-coenzyme A synthetase/AMP-(fatty) acid ligase